MSPSYDQQQILFCLSMLANISDSNKLLTDLADYNVQTKIGQWTIVWGPVIYGHDPKSQVWDNIMYVAKGENITTNNPQYVVRSHRQILSLYLTGYRRMLTPIIWFHGLAQTQNKVIFLREQMRG